MQEVAQRSWNEYDDGSENGDNEPYTIYINSDDGSSFPGYDSMRNASVRLASSVRGIPSKLQSLFSPNATAHEHRPLLPASVQDSNMYTHPNNTETDLETDADGDDSSNEFPSGYAIHYATFPSMEDQRMSAYQDMILFRGSIACYITSLILLFIASILMATGKHKLRIEVDLGVVVAVVTSIFFAILGLASMSYRQKKGSLSLLLSVVMFIIVCLINGGLLVFVVGNTTL